MCWLYDSPKGTGEEMSERGLDRKLDENKYEMWELLSLMWMCIGSVYIDEDDAKKPTFTIDTGFLSEVDKLKSKIEGER